MPQNRDINLNNYNISKNAYRELLYFCLQYPEKKIKTNDPCAERDCKIIEQIAIKAAPEFYDALIKNIAFGTQYRYLNIPCGINQFYLARKKFYYFLYMAKNR